MKYILIYEGKEEYAENNVSWSEYTLKFEEKEIEKAKKCAQRYRDHPAKYQKVHLYQAEEVSF
jgi:hypothetical protein